MQRIAHRLEQSSLTLMVILALFAPAWPPTRAASIQSESFVEDFTSVLYKEHTASADWDTRAHALRLTPIDRDSQQAPTIAIDSAGNAFVVWADTRDDLDGGLLDIYAQRLDANGNRLWPVDVRVNSDERDAYEPAIAVGSDGTAVVVWHGCSGICAQKIDPKGGKLWPTDVQVSSGPATVSNPKVALDASGAIFVVWEDRRGRSDASDIYGQRLNPAGDRLWSEDVRVNSDVGSAIQEFPSIAVDGTQRAVIVWRDRRNNDADIYAQMLDAAGARSWGSDVRVNSDDNPADQTLPSVAISDNGVAIVAWQDKRNSRREIFAQKLTGSGVKLWSADVQVNLTPTGEDQQYPAIAANTSGYAGIIWYGYRSGQAGIYAQRLDSSGARQWPTDAHIDSGGATASIYLNLPAVSVVPDGRMVIAWTGVGAGSPDVYAQKLDLDGSRLWGGEVRVNTNGGVADQTDPAVAVDRDGNALIAWSDARSGSNDIYAQRLDAAANKLWSAAVRVDSHRGSVNAGHTAVALDASAGDALVAWGDDRRGDWDVYVQRLALSGNRRWAEDVQLNSDDGSSEQRDPAIAVDRAGYTLAAWQDGRNGDTDVYAQRLDAAGVKLWPADLRVNSDSGAARHRAPAIAAYENQDALVIWQDDRTGDWAIYAQRIRPDGRKAWAQDVQISAATAVSPTLPTVTIGLNENAFMAWQSPSAGSVGIFLQKLDGRGNRIWPADVRVDSGGPATQRESPTVAVDGGNQVFVAWCEQRSHDAGIYAQRVGADGSRLWPEDLRVNANAGNTGQRDPQLATDQAGNAFVAWQDRRNANADIYAQKVNPAGGKAWLTDLQVVYPELFYAPTGLAESTTIDTIPDAIRSAILTADTQLNGGAIQFYLSNNGGADWAAVTPGVNSVFVTEGSDLRWRAVLTADPIWPRSPVLNSLRIESSTQTPYADSYEPDDSCGQARPISSNGAEQEHTFHRAGDADWAWFDAVAGVAYIVEARNIGPRSQSKVDVLPTCTAQPTGSARSFGDGYTVSFTAPETGRLYLKAYSAAADSFGPDSGYQLSVRTVRPTAVAVIVAGHDDVNSAQANITYAADHAYRVFRRAGIGSANIRYLAPSLDHDADGDGVNDIAGLPTVANVRAAIQEWAAGRGLALGVPFYLYLVDHGLPDRFKADGDAASNQVTAADLSLWLDNLEATTGADNVNVIIDTCYSGSFIAAPTTISGRNRVIISSTSSEWLAYGPTDGQGLYFSNGFFGALENQESLWASFQDGASVVTATLGLQQAPWLDDDGDSWFTAIDGALAASRALRRVAMGGQPPRIAWVRGSANTIQARITTDSPLVIVQAQVFAPSYTPPPADGSGTTRLIDAPTVALTDPDGDGVFVGQYRFTESGTYRLVAQAEDSEGNLALPVATVIQAGLRPTYLPLIVR